MGLLLEAIGIELEEVRQLLPGESRDPTEPRMRGESWRAAVGSGRDDHHLFAESRVHLAKDVDAQQAGLHRDELAQVMDELACAAVAPAPGGETAVLPVVRVHARRVLAAPGDARGHYNHLDTLNIARGAGSVEALIEKEGVKDGIVYSCVQKGIPLVTAGSIRDDGPLPSTIASVFYSQDAMRAQTRKATTLIALATQLHAIAAGNMTPSYQVVDGLVRPVYIYVVVVSEFAVNKLRDRGTLEVKSIVTNVQDFLVHLSRRLAAGGTDETC